MRAMLDQLMGSDNGMCSVQAQSLLLPIDPTSVPTEDFSRCPIWERMIEKNTPRHLNHIVVPCFSSFKAQRDNFSLITNICTIFDLSDELVSAIDLFYSNEFFIVFWVIKSFSQALTYSHVVLIYVGLKKAHASAASLPSMNLVSIKIREVASPCE